MIVRTRRVTLHLDDASSDLGMVASPSDAVRIAREIIGDCHTVNSTRVQPRDVFTPALLTNCAAFILAHNHPSGDPSPSTADRLVTMQLRSAGEMLGVKMLDHVIVTRDRWHSFKDAESWE